MAGMRLLTLGLCASLATGRGKGGECDAEDHDKRVCDNNNKCIKDGAAKVPLPR